MLKYTNNLLKLNSKIKISHLVAQRSVEFHENQSLLGSRTRKMSPSLDVVVIGCGASGIAALSKLQEAGLNVVGLEALDRTGGRIHSLEFAGGLVDIGAAWCNGEIGNKVFELASPYNLLGRPEADIEKCFIFSDGTVMPTEDVQTILNNITKAIEKADKNNTKSISGFIRDEAKKGLIADVENIQPFIEWYERDNNLGGQDDPRQRKSLKSLEENKICPGEFLAPLERKGISDFIGCFVEKVFIKSYNADNLPQKRSMFYQLATRRC